MALLLNTILVHYAISRCITGQFSRHMETKKKRKEKKEGKKATKRGIHTYKAWPLKLERKPRVLRLAPAEGVSLSSQPSPLASWQGEEEKQQTHLVLPRCAGEVAGGRGGGRGWK